MSKEVSLLVQFLASLMGSQTVNNQRGPVEENTGHLVGVRGELLTSKEGIKNKTSVRQSAGLNSQGGNGAAVCGISSSQPGERRVVV